jgi:hypothetical protein
MAVQPNGPDISTLLNGWQMPPPSPQTQAPGHVPDIDKLLDGWKLPDPPKPNDIELNGPPLMVRDSRLMEIPDRFQSSGKISIDGDIVTQQLGRGHMNEYSLSQLSDHSKDPEYFSATMHHAADHGDSVKIDYHHGIMSVTDPALERTLPRDMPLRDPILRASVIHNIDPTLLAAVGTQETNLGGHYLGDSTSFYNMTTHRGDREPDSPGGHGYGPWQYDDQKRTGLVPRPQDVLDRVARDPYYAADLAAGMLSDSLKNNDGNVRAALQEYNTGSATRLGAARDWGPEIGQLHYADSTLRFKSEIDAAVSREQSQDRGLGR